jgi:hypothetical protein
MKTDLCCIRYGTGSTIQMGKKTLRIKLPLTFETHYNYQDQWFETACYKLAISAVGQTLESSKEHALNDMFMLWDEYALEDSEKLETNAQLLKQMLLEHLEEI